MYMFVKRFFFKVHKFAALEFFSVLPGEVLAKGIWAVNKLFQVIHKGGVINLEYFCVTVKLDLVCFCL